MDNFKGKTAFITGGASGLGLAVAKACAEEGMNIVIADLRQSAIDSAMPILEATGSPALGIKLDVTDREAFEKAADAAEARFGKIHLLMNNAGIAGARGPLWAVSYRDADLALDINLRAVINGVQIIVPRILKHGEGGHIVSTSSSAGIITVPGCGLYDVTKQAVVALTESLATDLEGTNVGASVFCPGPYKTGFGMSSLEVQETITGEKAVQNEFDERDASSSEEFAQLERSSDEGARRVLRGIKRGDLYILTHSEFKKGYEARAAAVCRAFPDEVPNEFFRKALAMLVWNPVYETQTQVPALTE